MALMKRLGAALAVAAIAGSSWHLAAAGERPLSIYFIDVEGGQSTLIVTPAGQSLLVDTGYAANGRDASRILAAAKDAGVTRIDHLLLTHFHPDHEGGLTDLSGKIPIGTVYDHGDFDRSATMLADPGWPRLLAAYDGFVAARGRRKHVVPGVGTRLPLKGVEVTWVSSAGATIRTAVAGAGQPNPACPGSAPNPGEPLENPRSTGFYLRYGAFRFLDLGDLSGQPLFALMCPNMLLGAIDLYLVPHHGGGDVSYPATFAAARPRVAIVNNGETKGGAADAFDALHHVQGLEDVWQLHRAANPAVANFADPQIANLDESTGHWIKATAAADGSFTVTNGRTGESRHYAARH
jgi:competence protein ComEC